MVSDFSAPISKSVRIVGCGGRIRTYDLRVIASRRLRCPKCAFLALAWRISTAAPAYASLYLPQAALGNAPQRAPLVGLITRRTQTQTLSHNENEKRHPTGCLFSFWLRGKDSNLRPPGYEPDELPLLYPAICVRSRECLNSILYLYEKIKSFFRNLRIFFREPHVFVAKWGFFRQ